MAHVDMRILNCGSILFGMVLLIHATALGQSTSKELSYDDIRSAIELGRAGKVPIVQVGTFLGVSKGDFNVFVESPVARIAMAASRAFKQYRPFDVNNVTDSMRAVVYRVFIERERPAAGAVAHIVLQPRGAKEMDGIVQPTREPRPGVTQAYFDHFPDGEFDVVIATSTGSHKYK